MMSHVLDQLKAGQCDEAMRKRLAAWREAVLQHVASVQFDSVEEVGRQLGVPKQDVKPLPFTAAQQQQSRMTGEEDGEVDNADDIIRDAAVEEMQPETPAAWAQGKPQGPNQVQPFVPVADDVLDPMMYANREVGGLIVPLNRACKQPQTGSVSCCTTARFRKPSFAIVDATGRADMCLSTSPIEDAECWKRVFFADARMNFVRS